MMVSRPAQGSAVAHDEPRYTNMYELGMRLERAAPLAAVDRQIPV